MASLPNTSRVILLVEQQMDPNVRNFNELDLWQVQQKQISWAWSRLD
jgi:hypothetical protein